MKRIQRKRTKGWRMPPGAVYVGRGSKWGNPFRVEGTMVYCDASHRRSILPPWVLWSDMEYNTREQALRKAINLYESWARGTLYRGPNLGIVRPPAFSIADVQRELAGKDLACWCPLGELCHADVLLELANQEG